MKVVELREKNVDELCVVADELRASIHQNTTDVMLNKTKVHSAIYAAKKDLARVMTVINEKRQSA